MVNPVDAAIEKMLASSAATYPKRHAYFAHRYCRLLAKTCAANEIGHVAFTLCVTVAMVEDSKRYKGAVTFYNEQLMPLIGVKKWEALDLARRKAADHGWLYYDSGGRHKPGRYWVTIPAGLHDLEDTPCDESSYPVNGELDAASSNFRYPAKGELEETHYPVKGYRGGDLRGELDGDLRGYRGGEPSYLIPNPIPKKKTNKKDDRKIPDGFEEFYSVYPLHVARRKAEAAYVAALARLKTRSDLGTDPKTYLASKAAEYAKGPFPKNNEGKDCICHPATWLNGDRFDDQQRVAVKKPIGLPPICNAKGEWVNQDGTKL